MTNIMKKIVVQMLLALILGLGFFAWPAIASGPESDFDVLLGQWVRPDGGYTITIKGVDPDGKLDAAYANPRPLPFAQARASSDDNEIKVFLELRAGGYNGSTYNLTYDAASDTLRGVYYQAVAQQNFDIYFERVE